MGAKQGQGKQVQGKQVQAKQVQEKLADWTKDLTVQPVATLQCPSGTLRTINGVVMDDIAPVTGYVSKENGTGLWPGDERKHWQQFSDVFGMPHDVTVNSGIREGKTRMGIHMHELGGFSCVLSGPPASVWIEGIKCTEKTAKTVGSTEECGEHGDFVFPAGMCYYMPANMYMTAGNMGS